MIRKLAIILALLCVPLARGQSFQNPLQGPITSTSAACAVAGDQSCVWQKLSATASVATVQVSGTFSATLTVEANNGGASFTTLGTITTAGTTSYVVAGFTDFRVRASAYTSGTAFTTINSSSAPSGGVTSGTADPTGNACAANALYVRTTNGALYSCNAGVFAIVSGGTTLSLQTNGIANGSQTLLNLAGSTNVTVTDNGAGTDTFALTGLSPAPTDLAAVSNFFVTAYTQATGAWTTAQVTGNSVNGAANTPAYTLSGTPNTGNATTSFPLWYYFCAGATGPTTFSTNGTILGMNACAGFTGKYIDIHTPNGGGTIFSVDQAGGMAVGTIAGSSGITAAAGSNLGLNGRTQMRSAADGRVALNNNANGSASLTRFVLGTEASGNPAMCPSAQTWVTCDGAGTTANGALKSASYSVVNVLANATAPTIAVGGCGGAAASISANNGTAAFNINVGTTPTAAGCTVTMPAATTGWNCQVNDMTTVSTSVSMQKQTGAISTTAVVLQNFSDVTVATAPVASDIYHVVCSAY